MGKNRPMKKVFEGKSVGVFWDDEIEDVISVVPDMVSKLSIQHLHLFERGIQNLQLEKVPLQRKKCKKNFMFPFRL